MGMERENFEIVVDFISGIDPIETFEQDLQYIKDKVSTYRSIKLRTLDPVDNRYLDSILTMVHLLEYAYAASRKRFHPTICKINVDCGRGATVTCEGRLLSNHYPKDDSDWHDYSVSTPIMISQAFTMEGVPGHPWGVFSFDMYNTGNIPIYDSRDNVLIPVTLFQMGDCTFNNVVSGINPARNYLMEFSYTVSQWESLEYADSDKFLCTLSNENDALRYCENFPAPSIVMNVIKCGFDAIEDGVIQFNATQGGNGKDEESDTERTGSTEATVPQER